MNHLRILTLVLGLTGLIMLDSGWSEDTSVVQIGVLAKDGKPRCLAEWTPTAEYLSQTIPDHHFEIKPLDFEEVRPAVQKGAVDFVLTNSSMYVTLEMEGLATQLVTMQRNWHGELFSEFGGVIFWRSDRTDLQTLADLRGKNFVAVSSRSFGGWQTALRELKESGINPVDFNRLEFAGTHQGVVQAVLSGEADAGTVRTDTLEILSQMGEINLADFTVSTERGPSSEQFPLLCSTRLYPEWPLAVVSPKNHYLAEQVAIALIKMPTDQAAAESANYAGWTIALSYNAVHNCLKDLRVAPYEHYGITDLAQRYGHWLAALVIIIILMVAALTTASLISWKTAQHRRFLQTIIDAFPHAMVVVDRSFKVLTVNQKALRFEDPDVPLENQTCHGLFFNTKVPCSQNAEDCPAQRVFESGQTSCLQKTITDPDGVVRHMEVQAAPIYDQHGQITQAVEWLNDITERLGVQKAIERHERMLDAITKSARDGIIMIDNQGRISFWNPGAERIFGYTEAEAIGRDLHTMLAPERFMPAIREHLPVFMKTGEGNAVGHTVELSARHKQGHEIDVELSLAAVLIDDQWGAVGIVRDVSERKQHQRELEVARDELARTNTRLEESLQEAEQLAFEAQAANIAKSQFLATMSHEIRTPMNGVIGMTGLLLDTELNEKQRRFAEIVRSSGQVLMDLINDILDFSKIEADKLELETIDFDLRSLLENLMTMLALRAHDKGLEFCCGIDPRVPTFLRGDPGRLRQVLINLLGNAVKFTDQGEVVLRVSCEESDSAHARIRFEVCDTGVGIAPQHQSALFNPFQQVDSSTTRRYGGTGLGLAISQRLVTLMGGAITLESTPGEGSTFMFSVDFERQQNRTVEPLAASLPDMEQIRVLVVDDNATNREVVGSYLDKVGVDYEEEADSLAVIDHMLQAVEQGQPFQVVLMDMEMPERNGLEVGRLIRQDKQFDSTHLIMMTSLGAPGDGQRFARTGFAAYLPKPVQLSEMYECIQMVLTRGEYHPDKASPLITRHTLRDSRRKQTAILVVEDNKVNQQVACAIIEKIGYRAVVAENGQEAIEALSAEDFDVVLMDCEMPVMNGYDATKMIRDPQSKVRNHQIPIIAMTAHAMAGEREHCLKIGMDDYLTKPITPNHLVETLQKWVSGVIAAANPASAEKENEPPEQLTEPAQDAIEAEVMIADGGRATSGELSAGDGDTGRAEVVDRDVFDEKEFMDRVLEDPELALEVIDGYLEEIPGQFERIKTLVENPQPTDELKRLVHTLKGSSANLGARRLSWAARDLENAVVSEDQAQITAKLAEVTRLLDEFLRIICQFGEQLKS